MKSKSLRSSRKGQAGFTLVEIAIVLVIIGLLLGGVLKGQELIENAKIKNLKNDYQGIAAAVYGYKDRYNATPGDDSAAATRWTGAPAVVATSGNGNIDGNFTAACALNSTAENCAVFDHLRRAGLIAGNVNSANPRNAYGGVIAIHTQGAVLAGAQSGLNVCMGSLPAKAAEAIDAAFDDGNATTGAVRATLGVNNIAPGAAVQYEDNGSNQYTVCKIL